MPTKAGLPKESDELLYTVWSLVTVRNQLPAQVIKNRRASDRSFNWSYTLFFDFLETLSNDTSPLAKYNISDIVSARYLLRLAYRTNSSRANVGLV